MCAIEWVAFSRLLNCRNASPTSRSSRLEPFRSHRLLNEGSPHRLLAKHTTSSMCFERTNSALELRRALWNLIGKSISLNKYPAFRYFDHLTSLRIPRRGTILLGPGKWFPVSFIRTLGITERSLLKGSRWLGNPVRLLSPSHTPFTAEPPLSYRKISKAISIDSCESGKPWRVAISLTKRHFEPERDLLYLIKLPRSKTIDQW